QYRETDFAFVSRLLEEEGICYFFEHTKDKHTLVLGDSPSVHQPCPNQSKARYTYATGAKVDEDRVSRWHFEPQLRAGKYTLNDYYFEATSADQKKTQPSAIKVAGNDKYEMYDYPGYFAKRFDGDDKVGKVSPEGERTVKLRMQGEEAVAKVVNGAGNF